MLLVYLCQIFVKYYRPEGRHTLFILSPLIQHGINIVRMWFQKWDVLEEVPGEFSYSTWFQVRILVSAIKI